ncbi:diguanylate cyclase (GGDEF)-like protein [Brevibacillus sp. AG162]|uniref:sensor domain-containing diguanylate cyclase n=1 Tax=Brevibacillus sp. AG162 TaxID=2572910 RepID=UPI0011504BC8|nr:GGDEF domain-containing protein [Brevibacillus sp. AG162]TQK74132.1 diguanylate cyclase (GGDEF)-like protein [Brevibacillus sp. AG162]
MHEKHDVREAYARQLLERYSQWLGNIEEVELGEVEAVSREVDSMLSEQDSALHAELLKQIVELRNKVTEMMWISEHMKILHDLSHIFAKTFEESKILWKAFELVSRVMRADAFFIAFYDEGDSEIRIPISIDNGVNYGPLTIPYGQAMVSKVIDTRETIHIKTMKNEPSEPEMIRWGSPEIDTNTCIFVPLMLGNQIKGVISAQSYREFAYKKEHEELLKIIGFQVASAIETARLYERMYQMSFQDELTGIANYRAFHRDLEKLLSEEDASVSLIMLDSDSLKAVNDHYGHHAGDALIKQIAEAMKEVAGPEDTAYRYAGDEFMLLCPGSSMEMAEEKAHAIREYLRLRPLSQDDCCILIAVSVGIARYPQDANTADGLKRAADEALYRSKRKGKNCTTVYAAG